MSRAPLPPLPDAIRRASPLRRAARAAAPRASPSTSPSSTIWRRWPASRPTRSRPARGASGASASCCRVRSARSGLARRGRHAARATWSVSAARLGLPRLYAKDESQNPTWSYKDRLCAVAVSHAVETRRARHHDLLHRQPRRLHRRLRGAGRPAVRDLHAGLGARHDEDADAGVRRRRGRVPDVRGALGAHAPGRRAPRLVSDQRLRLAAGRLEPVGRRGLQDHRLRDRRGPGLDGARRRDRAERVQRRALRRSGRAGRSCTRSGLVKTAAAHDRGRAVRPARPRDGARARGAGDGRGAGAVGGLLHRARATAPGRGWPPCASRAAPACALTDEGIFEAQRALAREEGLFVEPSSADADHRRHAARRAARRSTRRRPIVVVLTSGGLKDPGGEPRVAARRARRAGDDFDASSAPSASTMDWRWTASLGVALSATGCRGARGRRGRARRSARASAACGSSRTTSTRARTRWPAPRPPPPRA